MADAKAEETANKMYAQADKQITSKAGAAMLKVLRRENELLDSILEEQQHLRECVKLRQWDKLMQTISIVSMLADDFNSTDNERDVLEPNMIMEEAHALLPLRTKVRTKLMRSKAASHALSEYIAVTQAFVRSVMDDAADSESANVYDKDGKYSRSTPRSVLVDCRG